MKTRDMTPPEQGYFFRSETNLANPSYRPAEFLNQIRDLIKVKNDAQLSLALNIVPPVISKIRNRIAPVTPSFLLRVIELTHTPPSVLKGMLYK